MSLENAKKFLERALADEPLRERVTEKEPAGGAARAKELGFDVTAEELDAAVRAMRQAAGEEPKELDPDEMDKAAGGAIWTGEDAPDGHEMGCAIFYHKREYSEENDVWCKQKWYCKGSFEVSSYKYGNPK